MREPKVAAAVCKVIDRLCLNHADLHPSTFFFAGSPAAQVPSKPLRPLHPISVDRRTG
jgi:hypothetical protein